VRVEVCSDELEGFTCGKSASPNVNRCTYPDTESDTRQRKGDARFRDAAGRVTVHYFVTGFAPDFAGFLKGRDFNGINPEVLLTAKGHEPTFHNAIIMSAFTPKRTSGAAKRYWKPDIIRAVSFITSASSSYSLVPDGTPLYLTDGFDQKGIRGQEAQLLRVAMIVRHSFL